MGETHFGLVLTVINNEPYKFSVNGIDLTQGTDDPLSRIPFCYHFFDESNIRSRPKKNFELKVTSGILGRRLENLSNEMHNQSIRFGLRSIQKEPNTKVFEFNTDAFQALKKESFDQGESLRIEILKFISCIYSLWPQESVGVFDLLDNFLNGNDELKSWIKAMYLEEVIVPLGNFKQFRLERGQVMSHAYRINPKKRIEINELFNKMKLESELKTDKSKPIKIFVSYITDNKVLAGKIKTKLTSYDIDVFVAHDTMIVSDEWRERILKELDSCNIFIALLTNEYRNSEWTDQEAGYAIALKKKIISIVVDKKPHGFLEKFQYTTISDMDVNPACQQIMNLIRETPELVSRLTENTLGQIRFDYSSANPTVHGWIFNSSIKPNISSLKDNQYGRVLRVSSEDNYYMDYSINSELGKSKKIKAFIIPGSEFYVCINLIASSENNQTERNVWLSYKFGKDNPPTYYADSDVEWKVEMNEVKIDNKWSLLHMDLKNDLLKSFNSEKLVLVKIQRVRLRGDFTIGKLEFYK